MAGLLRRVWSAAKEWRNEERDLRRMKVFLASPERRDHALDSATSAAKFLMTTLSGCVLSGRERIEICFECTLSTPDGKKLQLPVAMRSRWSILLLCMQDESGGFTYVTEKGPVRISVTEPLYALPIQAPRRIGTLIDKMDKDSSNVLIKDFLDEEEKFINETAKIMQTFIFSITRPA